MENRYYLAAFFTFAHLSLWAAAIFFRAAAGIVRRLGAAAALFVCSLVPFTLAHRAL
jgi:hypothetical protein